MLVKTTLERCAVPGTRVWIKNAGNDDMVPYVVKETSAMKEATFRLRNKAGNDVYHYWSKEVYIVDNDYSDALDEMRLQAHREAMREAHRDKEIAKYRQWESWQ